MRCQIFRQGGQIIGAHTDVWVLIFGQADGTICKQGVRRKLCGVALDNGELKWNLKIKSDTGLKTKSC